MPHRIAGVPAAPRWQWSSASGIDRESWGAIRSEDPRSWPGSTGERNDAAVRVERGLRATRRPELGTGDLIPGVIARAHERPRFDVPEAKCERLGLHLRELIGVVIALQREVPERRSEVLTDRQDVAAHPAQGLERLGHLRARLAEADHERTLRMCRLAGFGRVGLGPLENAERAIPAGALPDRLLGGPHRLEVVVEDVRPGGHPLAQGRLLAVEVGDQDLD